MKTLVTRTTLGGLVLAAGMGLAALTPVLAADAPQPDAQWVQKVEEHMREMQELMVKYWKTTDPAEREKLAEEHRKEMLEGMELMHQQGGPMMQGYMGGPGMMMGGPGMMHGYGGGMMGGGPGAMNRNWGSADARVAHLEKRVDALEMMLDQLVKRPAAPAGK
ncbi:MAG: hypothetical protein KF710_02725 [Rhodocyclaceae bacterium]|nr:hypothetical protein [Rhodocyclaceae bacterium]